MKWDDGNRKTNKTTNWSEKCYVAARAPREALLSRSALEGFLKLSLQLVINTPSHISDAVSPLHVTAITLPNELNSSRWRRPYLHTIHTTTCPTLWTTFHHVKFVASNRSQRKCLRIAWKLQHNRYKVNRYICSWKDSQ